MLTSIIRRAVLATTLVSALMIALLPGQAHACHPNCIVPDPDNPGCYRVIVHVSDPPPYVTVCP